MVHRTSKIKKNLKIGLWPKCCHAFPPKDKSSYYSAFDSSLKGLLTVRVLVGKLFSLGRSGPIFVKKLENLYDKAIYENICLSN